jgi:hypothetical protein
MWAIEHTYKTLDGHLAQQIQGFLYDTRQIRPLGLSESECWPPLDPSAGLRLVKRNVESLIPPGSNFSPDFTGRAMKGIWSNLGRQEEKIYDYHRRLIASDGSDLVPTTDVIFTLPHLAAPNTRYSVCTV